jgi:hypothetical protein
MDLRRLSHLFDGDPHRVMAGFLHQWLRLRSACGACVHAGKIIAGDARVKARLVR